MPLFELIYVTQGTLSIEQFHEPVEVKRNQVILLWPDRPHRGWKINPMDLVYFWAYFAVTPNVMGSVALTRLNTYRTVARPDHLAALFHRLIDDREANLPNSCAADLTLLSILHEAALEVPVEESIEPTTSLARRADAIIRSSFHLPIHPSLIAEQLACSADYLGRAYRNAYRMSLMEAIHRRRIQHACHLLMLGELSMEDIARQCGFSESGYFRRVFRRLEGMTPRHYQTLHGHGGRNTPHLV